MVSYDSCPTIFSNFSEAGGKNNKLVFLFLFFFFYSFMLSSNDEE